MGQHGELEQGEGPVALVVVRCQVLQLPSQREFLVDFVFSVGHEDVGVYHPALSLHDGLVVELVHVHQVELEVSVDALVHLDVEVLVVGAVAPFPEGGAITVGGMRAAVGVVVPVHGVHVGEVEAHVGAVFPSEQRVPLEVVTQFGLVCPLSLGLCGVGIECGECVGMVEGECGHVVDERGRANLRPL